MPTRRMFDLAVLVAVLVHPVIGLFKMAAARHTTDSDTGPLDKVVSGAAQIIS